MPTKINQIPFNQVPSKWAFDPEIGPFVRQLLQNSYQTRERTGGDVDIIYNIQYNTTTGTTVLAERVDDSFDHTEYLTAQLDALKRRLIAIDQHVQRLEAELATSKRTNSRLEAKLNSFIAEIQTNA